MYLHQQSDNLLQVHVLTREGKIPVLDIGALEKIRSGEVKIVPGIFNKYFKLEVESLLATGYRSNVSYSLQESDIFSKNGYQKAEFPNKWKGKSGVYRVGFEKRRLGGASALIRKGQNSAHRIRI